jgi:tetratricopeptide (TPR) repeat protein
MNSTGFINARQRRIRAIPLLALVAVILLFLDCAKSASAQTAPPVPVPTVRNAATALAAGNLEQAEAELQSILKTAPMNVHALNLLGIVRAQQKREGEAEALFKQAIALQPEFAGAQASLGLLYVQTAKNDLAIPPLQEALRLDPGREEVRAALIGIWRGQARVAAQRNDLEKALALLIEARKLNPDEPDVQYDLGMVALRMSLFPDAIDAFHQALKLRPDASPALYGLGRAQMGVAKFSDAQQSFEHYVQLRPADASGHYALGFTLEALQRSSEARAEYDKSIALQPQQTESYFHLGSMALDAGNLGAAQENFERVLKRAPQHAGALTGMGRLKMQEKKYSEAADLLAKAIATQPRLREAHYYLGLVDARLGRKEDSEKELQIASQIEHDEVEKHQTVLRVLDPDQVRVPEASPQQ